MNRPARRSVATAVWLGLALSTLLRGQDAAPVVRERPAAAGVSAADAQESIQRSLQWLLANQNPDGSYFTGTVEALSELGFSPASFHSWKMAGVALAELAFLAVEPTPETDAAARRALQWLLECELPRRGSDWDIDSNWALLYCFQAFVEAEDSALFAASPGRETVRARGLEFYELLAANQEPAGGWGYYEGPVVSRRPTWSTSFSTACVIPALVKARTRGWPIDAGLLQGAVDYVRRCRLPNGAYEYDLNPIPRIDGGEHINQVKGSLGRIQVCNWALRTAADPAVNHDVIRAGLEEFFRHHVFLDVARMKPIPHEAYYLNAGYFYLFGHCYAGLVINELPAAEREKFHARLRRHLTKVQWEDGSSIDFPGSRYLWVAGTSFSILALQAGLP